MRYQITSLTKKIYAKRREVKEIGTVNCSQQICDAGRLLSSSQRHKNKFKTKSKLDDFLFLLLTRMGIGSENFVLPCQRARLGLLDSFALGSGFVSCKLEV